MSSINTISSNSAFDNTISKSRAIALNDPDIQAENITYKIELTHHSNTEAIDGFLAKYDQFYSEQSVDNRINHLIEHGQQRDVQAVIYLDGKPAVTFRYDGGYTTSTANSGLVKQYANRPQTTKFEEVAQALQQKYGSDIKIELEQFRPGMGPTNAEFFEQSRGVPYEAHIAQVRNEMRSERLVNQLLQTRAQERLEQYNAVQQTTIFSVNGTIIGGLSDEGKLTIPTQNILQLSDSLGLEREQLRDYFQANLGQSQEVSSIQNLLRDVFGDAITTTEYEIGQGPTRAQLNNN